MPPCKEINQPGKICFEISIDIRTVAPSSRGTNSLLQMTSSIAKAFSEFDHAIQQLADCRTGEQ